MSLLELYLRKFAEYNSFPCREIRGTLTMTAGNLQVKVTGDSLRIISPHMMFEAPSSQVKTTLSKKRLVVDLGEMVLRLVVTRDGSLRAYVDGGAGCST